MADWVWYLGAAVLGAGGVVLFWWAWFGDRARGRARCGGCWYSLEALMDAAGGDGSALPVCPECGWRGKRRGSYLRTRRRRWRAAVAVLVAVGAAVCGATPKVRRDGVWSVAPTWVLLGAARWQGQPSQDLSAELFERLRLDGWARIAPDVYAWNRRIRLLRDSWVEGVPVRGRWQSVFVNAGSYRELNLYLEPGAEPLLMNDADPTTNQSHENWWTPDLKVVQPSRMVGDKAEFVVAVQSINRCGMVEPPPPFWAGVMMKRSLDQVMTPVVLDRDQFLRAIKPSLFVLPTTTNLALSVGEVQESDVGGVVALGVKVELVRRGVVLARGRWYQSPATQSMNGRPVLVRFGAYDPLDKKNGPMTHSLDELVADGCVVRFSTDEEMALSTLECEKYWRGSFEAPLKDFVK